MSELKADDDEDHRQSRRLLKLAHRAQDAAKNANGAMVPPEGTEEAAYKDEGGNGYPPKRTQGKRH